MTNESRLTLDIHPTSPYDNISKIDWRCTSHGDSHFVSACSTCVLEQLAAEYERGKKEAVKCTIVEREALEAAYKTYLNADNKTWSKYLEAFARLRDERLNKP